jgi:hypothetical protein
MMEKEQNDRHISRRGFLETTIVTATGLAALGVTGCDANMQAGEAKPRIPDTWERETDILIVGAGAAGISAAITALQEGLGDILVLDSAPEEYTGGNSRVCGQMLFIPKSIDAAVLYQSNLNGQYVIDKELLEAWATNLMENLDWLKDLGANLQETPIVNPEYPDIEGSEGCAVYMHDGIFGQSHLYELLKDSADSLGCTFEYNTRASQLVFDPDTKEVFGIKADQEGITISIKARKGVILACGGFENNKDMVQTYHAIGYWDLIPLGTPYNRGDGIKMALSVGADLWHMNSFANSWLGVPVCRDSESGGYPAFNSSSFPSKDFIYVGPDAKRYSYEETNGLCKHGKVLQNGVYISQHVPFPQHVIFGSKAFEAAPLFTDVSYSWPGVVAERIAADNQGYADAGIILKADTIRELAEMIGLSPSVLEQTVDTYNGYCAAGKDPVFNRGEDVYGNANEMASSSKVIESGFNEEELIEEENKEAAVVLTGFPLVALEPPFYAMRQYTTILNTQGGPKRNVEGQIVDTDNKAIPRLFAAGEMGCIYSYMYNGGGNLSEAISSGRLASRSISGLEPWDA